MIRRLLHEYTAHHKDESITTASTRTGKLQLHFALQLFSEPVMVSVNRINI